MFLRLGRKISGREFIDVLKGPEYKIEIMRIKRYGNIRTQKEVML